MRVLVVGRRLAAARGGREVTAIERRDAAAPGHASAWSSPQAAWTLLKSLIVNDHPLLPWGLGLAAGTMISFALKRPADASSLAPKARWTRGVVVLPWVIQKSGLPPGMQCAGTPRRIVTAPMPG